MTKALMITGTSSSAGKSTVVTALGRLALRQGIRVAPFKAQNMALNAAVTRSGHEIGRAQYTQAVACGVDATVSMNPILLKPTSVMESQVVVRGRPWRSLSASEYYAKKNELFDLVVESFRELASSCDLVLLEGAGSPAEINLLDSDIVNLRLADRLGIGSILVGDIELGGVFAQIFGTYGILPERYRGHLEGFIINKFRGDPTLLLSGIDEIVRRCETTYFGTIPYASITLPEEDSMALRREGFQYRLGAGSKLRIGVIALPHIANFTDFDPLFGEGDLDVSYVDSSDQLEGLDLCIVPGSKSTVSDLLWMRSRALDRAIRRLLGGGGFVVGICGGYQILGESIRDGVESDVDEVEGLDLLPIRTVFGRTKVTRRLSGSSTINNEDVAGYHIHHGVSHRTGGRAWLLLRADPATELENQELDATAFGETTAVIEDGAIDSTEHVFGVSLHGVFDADRHRAAFLTKIAHARSKEFTSRLQFSRSQERSIDELADLLDSSLDCEAIFARAAKVAIQW
ncbi:MAG: cobyric acid synthase [Acidimicrobiales bacterium]